MILIVGLGNPGMEYAATRHNVGFDMLTYLGDRYDIALRSKEGRAVVGKGFIEGQKVILAQPQTYMNLSGESVRALMDFYKLDEEDLVVICDDINLSVGQVRIRPKGSAGGHNGIKSIIAHAGTQEFARIKIGVGEKPPGWDLADYVLGHFSRQERAAVEDGIRDAATAAGLLAAGEAAQAMNLYNKKKKQI